MDLDLDKDVESILATFRDLKPSSRRVAYLELLNQLNPNEWRDLRDAANDKSFQCDILASLPLEIAAQIVKYFDLAEIFLLQRVSQQWKRVLTAHHACATALRWHTGRIIAIEAPDFDLTFTALAKQRTRLLRGKCITAAIFDSPIAIPEDEDEGDHGPRKMDYSHGRCASIQNRTEVAVRSIRLCDEGELEMFTTENREPIWDLRISETYLAVVTQAGRCHVWNHRTGHLYVPFRLPSVKYTTFQLSGHKVAFSFAEESGYSMVYHWDPISRNTYMAQVPRGLVLLGVHPLRDEFTSVHLCKKDGGSHGTMMPITNAQLEIITYSLTENNKFTPKPSRFSNLPVNNTDPNRTKEMVDLVSSIMPADHKSGYLQLFTPPGDISGYLAVTYDSKTDCVSLYSRECERPYVMPLGPHVACYLHDEGEPRHPTLRISTPGMEHRFCKSVLVRFSEDDWVDLSKYHIWGDEHFLLVNNNTEMLVYYFNENAMPAYF